MFCSVSNEKEFKNYTDKLFLENLCDSVYKFKISILFDEMVLSTLWIFFFVNSMKKTKLVDISVECWEIWEFRKKQNSIHWNQFRSWNCFNSSLHKCVSSTHWVRICVWEFHTNRLSAWIYNFSLYHWKVRTFLRIHVFWSANILTVQTFSKITENFNFP